MRLQIYSSNIIIKFKYVIFVENLIIKVHLYDGDGPINNLFSLK